MTLEAGKEMDRRCVMNWLYEVYITPSRAFSEYTDDELKMFAHDALVLLKEQEAKPLRCKECSYHRNDGWCNEHGREVKESDYCSFGAWEGR